MNYSINRRFIVRFTVGIVVAALSAAAIVGLSGGSDHQKSSSQLRRDNRAVTATKEKAQAPTLDPTTEIAKINEEKSSTVATQASDGSSAKAPAAPAAAVAPVAPPAAVAPVAPPAAVAPVGDHTGPTFGGVGVGCGVKTIFSITVSDPSGVAAVWGNYYNDAGVKTGFTMGPGQNGYWVVSIFDTDLDGFDSIYVAASDSAGNTSSTRVSGLCQV
ncbi:unannotated protein [freshwater metagenome]|uniref:Unannotated protein n=1 Tax=freshwater metagenome TaxID=449393 RepID=A0A6J6R8P6_9ZZZZ|nr:hypothetical protein [Actinomycetota bacterium]MSY44589.1 hypothetical protein [Actinomycetota bacterium]